MKTEISPYLKYNDVFAVIQQTISNIDWRQLRYDNSKDYAEGALWAMGHIASQIDSNCKTTLIEEAVKDDD